MTKIEELEAKLEAQREADAEYRKEQDERDDIAVLEAKLQYGEHAIAVLRLSRKAPGLPGLVIVQAPDKVAHKRFRDMAIKGDTKHAIELIQGDCRIYPDVQTFKAMRDVFQNLPDKVADAAVALAAGGAKDEGKA